jgi:hypothetical protein
MRFCPMGFLVAVISVSIIIFTIIEVVQDIVG